MHVSVYYDSYTNVNVYVSYMYRYIMMHTQMCMYDSYTNVNTCMYTCAHVCIYVRMYVYMCTCMYTFVHVCIHVYMYVHIHVYMYAMCVYENECDMQCNGMWVGST